MYYLFLSLIACATFSVYASQSDNGHSPLCVSSTSSDEEELFVSGCKRKRAEKEQVSVARPSRQLEEFRSMVNMLTPDQPEAASIDRELFRRNALDRFFSSVPTLKHGNRAMMPQVIAPIRPRVGINLTDRVEMTPLQRTQFLYEACVQPHIITELNLTGCDLTAIPACIHGLTELVELSLGGNKLGVGNGFAAVNFAALKKLRKLDLAYNQIAALPAMTCFMPHSVTILFLGGNLLTKVDPRVISANIELLGLSHNQLRSIPDLTDKSALKVLDIEHNRIVVFDPKKSLPTGMQEVNMAHNRIKMVAEENLKGWSMSSPGLLLLSYNRLESFPQKLCEVAGLHYLDLACNAINHMPVLSKKCLPQGGCIDIRANHNPASSREYLRVRQARYALAETNQSRPWEDHKITILAAATMGTHREGLIRDKWPTPKITYTARSGTGQ